MKIPISLMVASLMSVGVFGDSYGMGGGYGEMSSYGRQSSYSAPKPAYGEAKHDSYSAPMASYSAPKPAYGEAKHDS